MILVDVHAHLDHPSFAHDLPEVISRAQAAGVVSIITNGISPQTNRITLSLASRHKIIQPALGIYPEDVLRKDIESGEYPIKPEQFSVDAEISFIESQKDRIIAIGEIGLDFKFSEQKDAQIKVFKQLLELAKRLGKPPIIHSRGAERETVEILANSGISNPVLHCFSGKLKLVEQATKLGCFFSIPCNIIRSEHFQKVVEIVPISQILTETDSPLLPAQPGTRNEPAFIAQSIQVIARVKGLTPEETANHIYMNYQRIFLG